MNDSVRPLDTVYTHEARVFIVNHAPLTSGERAKNARSISLPSLQQDYLFAMATSFEHKLENKAQLHHWHVLNLLKSELRYCSQFLNGSVTK